MTPPTITILLVDDDKVDAMVVKRQGSRISNLLDLRFPLARLEADRLYAMA
jgi:hypothetical protein